jgi:cytochrome P450
MAVEYTPFAPEVREDPYPYYRALRDRAPVYKVEPSGIYAISRYADVMDIVKQPELYSSRAIQTFLLGSIALPADQMTEDERELFSSPILIATDPPEHTRMRHLVNRGFTPRRIAALEARVREITRQALERIDPADFDLVRDLAVPLPVTVIAELLGVDPERMDDFKRWSDAIVSGISGTTEEGRSLLLQARGQFRGYFKEVIERRRREPRDDLISLLVRAEEDLGALTPVQILGFTILLLVAGNETTTNLIGNTTQALLANPEQLAKVAADPTLVPGLVEEGLRYDSPIQGLVRSPTRDVELHGVEIPKGAMMLILFASANRDERQFADPDRFDVTRNCQGHVAFGFGIHYCLGAALARLEARVAFEELLTRFRGFERLEDAGERLDSFLIRGPRTLRMRAEPAR